MIKPTPPTRPREFATSYKDLGVVAQLGKLIEIRTPDPDDPKAPWPRIWLTPKAAETLMEWLPEAIAMQLAKPDEPEEQIAA